MQRYRRRSVKLFLWQASFGARIMRHAGARTLARYLKRPKRMQIRVRA